MTKTKCDGCGTEMNNRACECFKCRHPRCSKCNATLIDGKCIETEFQPEHMTVNEYLGTE